MSEPELYLQLDPQKKFLCFFQDDQLIYKTALRDTSDAAIIAAMERVTEATGVVMEGDTWALHPKTEN